MNQNDTLDMEIILSDEEQNIAVACINPGCSNSTTMETARLLTFDANGKASIEDCICCPDTCGEKWFKFIPPTSKEYAIFTNTGMFDAYGYLYDNSNKCIGYDDNKGITSNFCIFHQLTANQTYYICVQSNNNASGPFTLTVKPAEHVSFISIHPAELHLRPGISGTDSIHSTTCEISTGYLFATILPENANCKDVIWSSSDTSVVKVDRDCGLVRATNKTGRATITAKSVDGNYTATAEVIVEADGTPVRINASEINVMADSRANSAVLGKFSNQTIVTLMNQTPENENWYLVYGQMKNGTFTSGWCLGQHLYKSAIFGILEDVDELNIRSGASTNHNIVGTIYKKDSIEILENEFTFNSGYMWHKILYNGAVAYVVAGNNTPNFSFENRWVELVPQNSNTPVYTFSSTGVTLLKELEGFRAKAYKASSSENSYTIGYGHVITDGTQFITINGTTYSELTEDLANTLLMQDLNDIFIPKFNTFLQTNNIVLNQYQYDACIMDFILAKQHFKDYSQVLPAFIDGTTNSGLINRRTKEANLFVYNTYSFN